MRVPHVVMPEASNRWTAIQISDLVRIIRVAQGKYGEDAEVLRAGLRSHHVTEEIVEHFELLAKQCGVYADRLERATSICMGATEIEDEDAWYSFEVLTSLNVKSVLEHTCPRCERGIPNDEQRGAYSGAISRLDNRTEVCTSCGIEEAMIDFTTPRWGASI